jgi:hypothetical protein
MAKVIEMTGSPKPYFKTKAEFLKALEPYGFTTDRMRKRDNKVMILVTNNLNSPTNKMKTARELGIAIMTYQKLAERFEVL